MRKFSKLFLNITLKHLVTISGNRFHYDISNICFSIYCSCFTSTAPPFSHIPKKFFFLFSVICRHVLKSISSITFIPYIHITYMYVCIYLCVYIVHIHLNLDSTLTVKSNTVYFYPISSVIHTILSLFMFDPPPLYFLCHRYK